MTDERPINVHVRQHPTDPDLYSVGSLRVRRTRVGGWTIASEDGITLDPCCSTLADALGTAVLLSREYDPLF